MASLSTLRKRKKERNIEQPFFTGELNTAVKSLTSVLKSIKSGESLSGDHSDLSDFEELPPSLPQQKRARSTRMLPSMFLSSKRSKSKPTGRKEKIYSYDRDIICLPKFYGNDSSIKIPRKASDREFLAKNGLIGKIRLTSDMNEKEIINEIRSVFKDAMHDDEFFDFKILQMAGGTSKSLMIPSLSSSFKWTASAVAGRNAKTPVYVLAIDSLKCEIDEIGFDSDSFDDLDIGTSSKNVKEGLSEGVQSDLKEEEVNPLAASQGNKSEIGGKNQANVIIIDEDKTSNYSEYVDLLGDQENYICDSPVPPPISPLTPSSERNDSLTISELIQTHRAQYLPIDQNDKVRIVVRRKHVLRDTLHQLRCGLDVSKHLTVTFIGEPAVDAGGPMREYLNTLMSSIAVNNNFFSGEESRRVPTNNVVESEKKSFFYIGVIFALSLLHGGPGPKFLAPAVADYIVSGIESVQASAEDIPNKEIREKVLKIQEVKDTCHLQTLLNSSEYDFRYDIGIVQPSSTYSVVNKDSIVHWISKYFAILKVKAELDQIVSGLSTTLNVLDLVRDHPLQMKELFVFKGESLLSWEGLYNLLPAKLSVEGCNKRELEEAVMVKWVRLIQMIEAASDVKLKDPRTHEEFTVSITLSDILMFVTGSPTLPPVGFIPTPAIQFQESSMLPMANTCTNTLHLPLQNMAEEVFEYNIVSGIINSPGFGRI